MSSLQKSDFAIMCRELRVQNRLKQREVAERIGVQASTYGNIESSPFKVVGAEKVSRMATMYRLTPDQFAALSDAWERCPLSPFSEKRRKIWQRRNKMRSKAKHHDRLFLSLLEVLGVFIPHLADEDACTCGAGRPPEGSEFGWEPPAYDERCEMCCALENLGLNPYTTRERVLDDLSKLQEKLELKDAAAEPANGTAQ